MYGHQGLQDFLFLMLYGGATMLAMLACCYFLFTRGNLFSSDNVPPRVLRRWGAAFMASVAASHVWWYLLGIYYFADDRLMRNIVAIALDRLTLVPLMMCVLIRMLQDRRRQLWPVLVAIAPIAVGAVICAITRQDMFEVLTEYYSMFLVLAFLIYYIRAIRQNNRWLRENYADLERKELWQSMLLLAVVLLIFVAYASNEGALATEYLSQVNTFFVIGFILWRVETLPPLGQWEDLSDKEPVVVGNDGVSNNTNLDVLLSKICVDNQLYLQHDLTLQQLATAIGTNRTYLSSFFAQRGITYNAYINQLRIDHFIRLYRDGASSLYSQKASQLALQSGVYSYSTFSAAFKKYKGVTVTAWMKNEGA